MKMNEIGEFGFIRSIMDECHFSSDRLIKGIGDDCAVVGPYDGKVLLISTDLLVEDVHFNMEKIPPEHLGEKAVAVNLSDIAAMGGGALHIFVSMAIPKQMDVEIIHDIYKGIKGISKRFGVNILGGDTSASPDRLMINLTVMGEAFETDVLYRSGAGPGDRIFVSGTLGDSAVGLMLAKGDLSAPGPVASVLTEAHNRPQPYLEAGRRISRSGLASAMIDLSDGLISDLGHVCSASGQGARLFQDLLPCSDELRTVAELNGLSPDRLALSGGEDYRLLITVPSENVNAFQELFKGGKPCHVFYVGQITETKGIKMVGPDGVEGRLEITGFEHFTGT